MNGVQAARIIEQLRSRDNYVAIERRGEELWAGVTRLMYHYTIRTGALDFPNVYDEGWCYTDDRNAVIGHFREWAARGFEGEPNGWHRHPLSGRRRVNGDPSTEYVGW